MLLDHWLAENAQAPNSTVTLVPNQQLGRFLGDRYAACGLPGTLQAVSLWDMARSWLPASAVLAPIGMEKAVAWALAREFSSRLPQDVPGIDLNVVRHALELRRRHIVLPAFDQIPWPDILAWMDRFLPASLYDESRVYHYASEAARVHGQSSGKALALYGYVEAHAAQLEFLDILAQQHSITVYTPWMHKHRNDIAEPWVAHWVQRGAGVQDLGGPAGDAREYGSWAPRGTPFLQELSGRLGQVPSAGALLVLGGVDPEPVMHFAQRQQVTLAGASQVLRAARNTWDAFWRLARHKADEADRINWLESMAERGVAPPEAWSYVQAWSKNLPRLHSWAALVPEILAAGRFHRRDDLNQALAGVKDWVLYDGWQLPPTPTWLDELFALLPFAQTAWQASPGIAWAQGVNARMLLARVVVLAIDVQRYPHHRVPDALWPPEIVQRFGLPSPDHAMQQDLHVLHLLMESGASAIHWVGTGAARAQWPPGIAPVMAEPLPNPETSGGGEAGARVRAWYHSHYDEVVYSAYNGQIGPNLGERLALNATPSSLEQFGSCPLSYFYARILKLAEEDTADPFALSPSLRGQWVHWCLERLSHVGGDMQAGDFQALVQEAVQNSPPPARLLRAVLRAAQADIVRELQQVWPTVRSRPGQVVRTEHPVRFQVGSGLLAWNLQGRIDRIDELGGGAVMVTDYKTGHLPDPNKVRAENLQMPLYRLAVQQEMAGGAVEAQLLGVSFRNQFQRRTLDVSALSSTHIEGLLEGIAERVRGGQFYPLPRMNQDPCRLCAFTALCPGDIKSEARRKHAAAGRYWQLWEEEC